MMAAFFALGIGFLVAAALVAAYALLGGLVLARAAQALRHGPPRI